MGVAIEELLLEHTKHTRDEGYEIEGPRIGLAIIHFLLSQMILQRSVMSLSH